MKNNKEYDVDLWGNKIETNPLLRDKFIEPPFSVIDTKTGSWQTRKKHWKSIGIKSEVSREDVVIIKSFDEKKYGRKAMAEVSIFDPALCEVLYHWFCPEGGTILDPFAGGSVRGIVANYLGFKYTGIDIRQKQIDSNREQALDILEVNNQPNYYVGDSNKVLDDFLPYKQLNEVKISVKSLKQKFHPCEISYILNVCKGRCCEGSNGLKVTIHNSEIKKYSDFGATIENNFIKDVNGSGICIFKNGHLCSVHADKPFGCQASPFTLTQKNTLIIRNRYRLLKCYNTEDALPAYISHRWSLERIFGKKTTDFIISKIEKNSDDFTVKIDKDKLDMLIDNDMSKHPDRLKTGKQFDFIFSCPPYADLEVYSDLKDDISNMPYTDFLKAYKSIIKKSCALLKPGGYACFVVGEIRDKKGNYIGFVPDTITAFKEAGLNFYNEAILLNTLGTAMLRASNCMKNKKLVKVHQNVLVFKKDIS